MGLKQNRQLWFQLQVLIYRCAPFNLLLDNTIMIDSIWCLFFFIYQIQKELGCRKNPLAFDIRAACSGFVLGLMTAGFSIRGNPFSASILESYAVAFIGIGLWTKIFCKIHSWWLSECSSNWCRCTLSICGLDR